MSSEISKVSGKPMGLIALGRVSTKERLSLIPLTSFPIPVSPKAALNIQIQRGLPFLLAT